MAIQIVCAIGKCLLAFGKKFFTHQILGFMGDEEIFPKKMKKNWTISRIFFPGF